MTITITDINPNEVELFRSVFELIKPKIDIENLPSPPDDLLNVEEAAALLKLSTHTIYQMTSNNEIPFWKKSKRLYFSKAELMQYLNIGRQEVRKEKNGC